MEDNISKALDELIAKVNDSNEVLFEGNFNYNTLVSDAKKIADVWAKITKPDAYTRKVFRCTLYPALISWTRNKKLEHVGRNLGNSDEPRNLLWLTVVFMYYRAIEGWAGLRDWLLVFRNTYSDYFTAKGMDWVEEHAPKIVNCLDKNKPWPDPLRNERCTTTGTSRADDPTTPKLYTSPLDVTAQNLSDPREETVNTDALYHLSQLEDVYNYFERNTENLPKLKKSVGVLATKIVALVIGSG